MNRGKIALKNSGVGLAAQGISIILQFITRSFFINYLGVEMLGLSSTFSSLLGALSMAELGFQTAVVYNLYKPLAEEDHEAINKVINIYKFVYRAIGIFFIAASLCCLPLLPHIVTGIEVNSFVRCVFLIQAAGSACTYFLAYKRSILYADQRGYLSNLVDMIVNIIANIIQIVLIVWLRNYIAYLTVKLIQTYVGNIIVHVLCTKKYPYLYPDKIDKNLFKKIAIQVKDVFSGKIASYIYSSTDSLVISIFVSTVQVGFFNNYTIITNNIKVLANSITTPIAPIIGNMIAREKDGENQIFVFDLYNYVRFLLAGMVVAPVIVLADSFIEMWIGAEYILPSSILLLLATDLYIHIMHSSCCDYISGNGLFRTDKYISVIGAISNIATSIVFVKQIGIAGVLVGTVLSQVFFWVARSFVTYKHCFHKTGSVYLKYWLKQLFYCSLFCGVVFVQRFAYRRLMLNNLLLRFITGGIMCEAIFLAETILLCFWMPEEKRLLQYLRECFNKKAKK